MEGTGTGRAALSQSRCAVKPLSRSPASQRASRGWTADTAPQWTCMSLPVLLLSGRSGEQTAGQADSEG